MGVARVETGWSAMPVLVTGAAGLLGATVSKQLLEARAAVIGLDIAWDRAPAVIRHYPVKRVDGDVRDTGRLEEILRDTGAKTVIHLAAQTLVAPAFDDPVETFAHNIQGTWSVLEACRKTNTVDSVVVASSDKAYGDWSGRPYREDMALRARHPYEVSKAAADLLAQSYAATYGLPVAVTRCANLYGGGDLNWSRVVPGTIRAVLRGERPVIRSDGSPVRDYLHVTDAGRGLLLLATAVRAREEIRGAAFNFAAGRRLRTIDLVNRILRLMSSRLEPQVLGLAEHEILVQRVSAARARRVLGWRAEIGLDQGLLEAISWYRSNAGALA